MRVNGCSEFGSLMPVQMSHWILTAEFGRNVLDGRIFKNLLNTELSSFMPMFHCQVQNIVIRSVKKRQSSMYLTYNKLKKF